jgi:hypothetical protein
VIPRRALLFLALVRFAPAVGLAQGGPPLVTDDPGTPGSRRWEVNVAFLVERRGSERIFEAPLVDANYGVGDRIQVKLEIPWIFQQEDSSTASGAGNALFGVKWRFLDGKDGGLSIATYPQVEVNVSRSSADKGLVERQPALLLPLSFAASFGPIAVNVEIGHEFRRGRKPLWIYGLALGHDFGEDLEILGEIFGETSARVSEIGSGWNLGARWKVGRGAILLLSAGGGFSGTAEEPRSRFQSYAGIQLLF